MSVQLFCVFSPSFFPVPDGGGVVPGGGGGVGVGVGGDCDVDVVVVDGGSVGLSVVVTGGPIIILQISRARSTIYLTKTSKKVFLYFPDDKSRDWNKVGSSNGMFDSNSWYNVINCSFKSLRLTFTLCLDLGCTISQICLMRSLKNLMKTSK